MTEDRDRLDEAAVDRALTALAAAPPSPPPAALILAMQAQARAALPSAPGRAATSQRPASSPARPADRALARGGLRTAGPHAAGRGTGVRAVLRRAALPAACAASALVGLALGQAAPSRFAAVAPFGLLEDPAMELVDLALSLPAEPAP